MIHWLIDVSLRNRFLVMAGFILLGGWGYWALRTVPIDAIPDLSDNQVIVFTDWPGRSPQEVEDQITYPLTVGLTVGAIQDVIETAIGETHLTLTIAGR